MKATEALWAQEVRHHALSISPEMHDFFVFLRESGWYETVVDRALNEVLEVPDHEKCPPGGASCRHQAGAGGAQA